MNSRATLLSYLLDTLIQYVTQELHLDLWEAAAWGVSQAISQAGPVITLSGQTVQINMQQMTFATCSASRLASWAACIAFALAHNSFVIQGTDKSPGTSTSRICRGRVPDFAIANSSRVHFSLGGLPPPHSPRVAVGGLRPPTTLRKVGLRPPWALEPIWDGALGPMGP